MAQILESVAEGKEVNAVLLLNEANQQEIAAGRFLKRQHETRLSAPPDSNPKLRKQPLQDSKTLKTSRMAIAAMVIAFFSLFPPIWLFAVILAVVALVRISRSRGKLKGRFIAVLAIVVSTGVMVATLLPSW